jgi:hypothetical protein
MLQEHQRIKAQPRECNLETVVAAIMLWSDSTHLVSFSHAALWPIYLFIGNQSKYLRNKPLKFAAHHLAYIPKVSMYFESSWSILTVTYTVTRCCTRILYARLWESCDQCSPYPSQAGSHARYLAPATRRRIHACLQAWYCCSICR